MVGSGGGDTAEVSTIQGEREEACGREPGRKAEVGGNTLHR